MANLKLDIIYYKTSADFEMEFNLGGCCRMRLFKDKVETQKELIKTLARDVSRSKIILIVTDLVGENCAVPAIAKAISLPLVPVDKNNFAIRTSDPIFTPETAIPLVTKSGIYGGCLIESGPQSIIILSSVRSLRHEIMKTYVHNYVFDIAQLMAYNERMGNSSPTSPIGVHPTYTTPVAEPQNTLSQEETSEQSDEDNSESPEQEVAEQTGEQEDGSSQNFEDVFSTEPTTKDSDEQTQEKELQKEEDAPSDLEKAIEEQIKYKPRVKPGINEVDSLDFEDKEFEELYKKSRKRSKGLNILLLIIVILLLISFGVLAYFFIYLPMIGEENTFIESGNELTRFISNLF